MKLPHAKFLIAGALIVGGICYLMFSGINGSMVYYYTLTELSQQAPRLAGQGVRISGHVRPGSIDRDKNGSRVQFEVYEKGSDREIPVVYAGIIPDTFKDDAEVVVEGIYDPSSPTFTANTLLAKCPSKYEAMANEHPDDIPVK
ncbi:MAG: cytochrome c maturation protein CcmE [Acidobacteriota bacterium]